MAGTVTKAGSAGMLYAHRGGGRQALDPTGWLQLAALAWVVGWLVSMFRFEATNAEENVKVPARRLIPNLTQQLTKVVGAGKGNQDATCSKHKRTPSVYWFPCAGVLSGLIVETTATWTLKNQGADADCKRSRCVTCFYVGGAVNFSHLDLISFDRSLIALEPMVWVSSNF